MAGEADMACEVCKLNAARVKEQRDFRNQKLKYASEFLVCDRCSNLNNFFFLRLMNADDKKAAIAEMLEGEWDAWLERPKKQH